jgi:hypothetical protein
MEGNAPRRAFTVFVAVAAGLTAVGANQEWAFDAAGDYSSPSDTSFVLASLNTGMTAEVKGNSTASGAKVDQWPGNGGSNQTWVISAA